MKPIQAIFQIGDLVKIYDEHETIIGVYINPIKYNFFVIHSNQGRIQQFWWFNPKSFKMKKLSQ